MEKPFELFSLANGHVFATIYGYENAKFNAQQLAQKHGINIGLATYGCDDYETFEPRKAQAFKSRLQNYNRDGWTDRAWSELEKAREGLYWAGLEIDSCVGSGRGSFGPEQLDDMIKAAENALRRMKAVRSWYE